MTSARHNRYSWTTTLLLLLVACSSRVPPVTPETGPAQSPAGEPAPAVPAPTPAPHPLPKRRDAPRPAMVSTDPAYAVTPEKPVKVGGGFSDGAEHQEAYLKALRGPDGKPVTWKRLGTCCPFKTPNGIVGERGLLDRVEVTYKGLAEPVILYLNLYDRERPLAPVGFTLAP